SLGGATLALLLADSGCARLVEATAVETLLDTWPSSPAVSSAGTSSSTLERSCAPCRGVSSAATRGGTSALPPCDGCLVSACAAGATAPSSSALTASAAGSEIACVPVPTRSIGSAAIASSAGDSCAGDASSGG